MGEGERGMSTALTKLLVLLFAGGAFAASLLPLILILLGVHD